ncbi:MAG: membrane protein insertase YidC [Pseudobdellovibrionaceae bacterium]|nr:membrane protein insertase YidC [Bdellovibrionales bacterium]USN46848.1 MAG: membrane protein insertase YidC [Pseudobdellovibrionaceae bacterium]
MNQPQSGQNFLDKNTVLAIAIVTMIWVGWTYYQQKKYPDYHAQKEATSQKTTEQQAENASAPKSESTKSAAESGSVVTMNTGGGESLAAASEKTLKFDDEKWSFVVSSKGMGLRDIVLKQYSDRHGNPVNVGVNDTENLPFSTNIIGRNTPIDFSIERTESNQFSGRALVGGMTIVKTMIVHSDTFTLESKVSVESAPETFSGVTLALNKQLEEPTESSSLLPSFERQDWYVEYDGSHDRQHLDFKNETNENYSRVNLASMSSQYFALAVLDKSQILPDLKAKVDLGSKTVKGTLFYNRINKTAAFDHEYLAFAGPKSLRLLESIDGSMANMIDLGWFSSIGIYILKLMKWFYSFIGNWGLSIILLTVVVRLLVLPANLMSYKSMKGMQKIQPEMKMIREKYKDDKQKLNEEMVRLMREAKANPLGGCLPMLIQFPVFIALYQVLGQSIELYQAPFGLWIHDLSLKDPYFILPVMMGVTMFVQQKITPSTMDPAQAKVMLVLPVVFAFFMAGLPAGLTLYIFVSALFGVFQQMVFMRPDKVKA